MDQIPRRWSRDDVSVVRLGWRRDDMTEVAAGIAGWWSCNQTGWDGFRVKVIEDEEETLFRLPVEEKELEMVELLQYATHVYQYSSFEGNSMHRLAKVLQIAKNPFPYMEHLSIQSPTRDLGSCILESIASNKLPGLTSFDLAHIMEDFELLGAAAQSGYLSALKRFGFCYCDVSVSGHITLAKAMESGHLLALEELDLARTEISGAACEAYAAGVGKLPCLRKLNFSGNRIGNSGAQALGRGMRLGELKHLDLSTNGIGDEGLIALAESFQAGGDSGLPKLEELNLSGNAFTEVSLRSLANAISSGRLNSLKNLHLSDNRILDEGLEALADSFQVGPDSVLPNIQYLNLAGNPFTEVGVLSLAKAISSGRLNSLEKLIWLKPGDWKFDISQEGARTLVSALASLKNVTIVSSGLQQFPALQRRQNQNTERNKTMRAIMKGLEGCPVVPARVSKVYICGDPEVGKTTLRKTLQRSLWRSLLSWEGKPHAERRTRGIDVSPVTSKRNKQDANPITLLVWDMAGQNEYHLLHNAVFLDLNSARGRSTCFIIVCSSETNLRSLSNN